MVSLLLADDESRTRNGLISMIEHSGLSVHVVGAAANGAEGLSLAKELLPDIILTDVRMPKMDGILLCREARKYRPDCEIIFISGYSDKEYLKSAISLKAVSYVEKPIEKSELLQAVTAAVDAVNARKENRRYQEQQVRILHEKAALDLLSPIRLPEVQEVLQKSNPSFMACPRYQTLLVKVRIREEEGEKSSAISEEMKSLSEKLGFPFLLGEKEPLLFVLHLGFPEGSPTAFSAASFLQKSLRTSADSFIAIGSSVSDVGHLLRSFETAAFLLKQLFFLDYGHICPYMENEGIRDTAPESVFQPDRAVFSRYLMSLKSEDFQAAGSVLRELEKQISASKRPSDIEAIKDTYYQLLTGLASVCRERGLETIFIHGDQHIWETVAKTETFPQLKAYLDKKLFLYQEQTNARKGASKLVYRICQYAEIHYADPALSVHSMADELHYTPAYLCQIFKAVKNMTIISYINQYRIDAAKKLLREKGGKVYEISVRVGYRDPDHFTRQFRKYVGISPSEYREKYLI